MTRQDKINPASPLGRAGAAKSTIVAAPVTLPDIGADPALVASQSSQSSLSRPSGFDPGEGSLHYRVSWPRLATPCTLVPLWKGEFRDFDDWVSKATTRLTGTTHPNGHEVAAICVDAVGRRCTCGGDFARARDEGAFPVRYFWECVPEAAQ